MGLSLRQLVVGGATLAVSMPAFLAMINVDRTIYAKVSTGKRMRQISKPTLCVVGDTLWVRGVTPEGDYWDTCICQNLEDVQVTAENGQPGVFWFDNQSNEDEQVYFYVPDHRPLGHTGKLLGFAEGTEPGYVSFLELQHAVNLSTKVYAKRTNASGHMQWLNKVVIHPRINYACFDVFGVSDDGHVVETVNHSPVRIPTMEAFRNCRNLLPFWTIEDDNSVWEFLVDL